MFVLVMFALVILMNYLLWCMKNKHILWKHIWLQKHLPQLLVILVLVIVALVIYTILFLIIIWFDVLKIACINIFNYKISSTIIFKKDVKKVLRDNYAFKMLRHR